MDTITVLRDWFKNIRLFISAGGSVIHSNGREETGIFEFHSIHGHYSKLLFHLKVAENR